VAQNTTNRASAIDGRTTRHAGYAVSQRRRKRVEEIFGWLKTVGPAAAGDRRRMTPAGRHSARPLRLLRAAWRTTVPSSSSFSAAC